MTDKQPSLIQKALQQHSEAVRRAIQIPPQTYSIPRFEIPRIPTSAEQHAYESSSELLARLASRIRQWRAECPKDAQPVILAVLTNGSVISVRSLMADGHNGVVIIGDLDGAQCMLLSHQANVQLLCYIEQVQEKKKQYTIGFTINGEETKE